MSDLAENDDMLQHPDEMMKRMGARIKALRKQKGFTNADFFAYHHNISRSQYHRYENGLDLRFSSIIKLANAFEMTIKDFFSEGFSD